MFPSLTLLALALPPSFLVSQLGSDDYFVRQQATVALKLHPSQGDVYAALLEAKQSRDAEVRWRAREIAAAVKEDRYLVVVWDWSNSSVRTAFSTRTGLSCLRLSKTTLSQDGIGHPKGWLVLAAYKQSEVTSEIMDQLRYLEKQGYVFGWGTVTDLDGAFRKWDKGEWFEGK